MEWAKSDQRESPGVRDKFHSTPPTAAGDFYSQVRQKTSNVNSGAKGAVQSGRNSSPAQQICYRHHRLARPSANTVSRISLAKIGRTLTPEHVCLRWAAAATTASAPPAVSATPDDSTYISSTASLRFQGAPGRSGPHHRHRYRSAKSN